MNSTSSRTSGLDGPSPAKSSSAALRLRRLMNSVRKALRTATIWAVLQPARRSPRTLIACTVWVPSAMQKGGMSRLVRLNPINQRTQIKHDCRFDPRHCHCKHNHGQPACGFLVKAFHGRVAGWFVELNLYANRVRRSEPPARKCVVRLHSRVDPGWTCRQ